MAAARYVPTGIAAIAPQALGVEYSCAPPTPNRCLGSVSVVSITGPITHDPGNFDTYAAIESRFDDALTEGPAAIVLQISSPGGDVAGSFDCARNMRRKAAAAGVRVVSFTDSQACSAGYALACAGSRICCSDTALLGSVGVLVQPVDATRADALMGLKFETITSGERKADGNPHLELSSDARAAIEKTVGEMAGVFYEHVAQSRAGLTAARVRAMQAQVLVGRAAVAAGLADEITTLAQLLESLGASAKPAPQPTEPAAAACSPAPQSKAPMFVPAEFQQKFHALVSAGASHEMAREQITRDAEAAVASLRGTPPPAPHAAPAPAPPKPRTPFSPSLRHAELEAIRLTHEAVARYWEDVAAGRQPHPDASVASATAAADPHASQLTPAEAAALDTKCGISPKGMVEGTRFAGNVQTFGVPVPGSSAPVARAPSPARAAAPAPAIPPITTLSRAEIAELDRAALASSALKIGTRVAGNVQQFGV